MNRTIKQTNQAVPADAANAQTAALLQAHEQLLAASIAFAGERDPEQLLEKIVVAAKTMTLADGAVLYLRGEDDCLNFAIVRSETQGLSAGGSAGQTPPAAGIPLFDAARGQGNHDHVAVHAALSGESIEIDDIYASTEFAFAGTRRMDEQKNYRTHSMLVVPLKDHHGECVAVLQLTNATDPDCGKSVPFADHLVKVVEALAASASLAYDNHSLIKAQKDLFESFVHSIAGAIDAKSPHTSGHCQRVPVLHDMIAEAACQAETGPFAEFDLSEEEKYELRMAAWLHDCGKISVPEYIIDKSTKLETMQDGIGEIATRIEVVKRDLEISYLKRTLIMPERSKQYRSDLMEKLSILDRNRELLMSLNYPDARPTDDTIRRLRTISTMSWKDWTGQHQHLLTQSEVENLSIRQGTLNETERNIVRSHVDITIRMLSGLALPRNLKRLPEIAAAHHEHIDGTGYPNQLTGDEMSTPAKMLAVADVFEALTANDRPYKRSKSLNQAMAILAKMRDDNHIDADIFNLFLESQVWLTYADKYMAPELIDRVDINRYRKSDDELSIEDTLLLAAE